MVKIKYTNQYDVSVKIANYNDKITFPSHISVKARDFIMCCLRKSPFHRKNVTKLLKHPFIKFQSLSKMEKSFDDVSELDFGERLKTPNETGIRRLESTGVNNNNNNVTPVKNPNVEVKVERDHKADLLNILKKIEMQKKEEILNTKNNAFKSNNQHSQAQNNINQQINSRFTQQTKKNDEVDFKKSPEIEILNDDKFNSANRLANFENLEISTPQRNDARNLRREMSLANKLYKHNDESKRHRDKSESIYNQSSSEFI